MADAMHPAAPHHLPAFITAPGETDVLLVVCVVILTVLVFVLGGLYFWLHSIPERIAHGTNKLQFQLVAVLALLALFTHNNVFWVAALLLALVPIPDFWTPLANMAESLARMAGRRPRDTATDEAVVPAMPALPLIAAPASLAGVPFKPSVEVAIEANADTAATIEGAGKRTHTLSAEGA